MKELFIEKGFTEKSLVMIAMVNSILDEYAAGGYDLSLRQLYYQLVARDHIPNTVRSYKNLGNLVNDARLAGHIDWTMIVDRNRSTSVPQTWEDPAQIVDAAARSFRIDKWEDQPVHVEVMVEKDALSGVLQPVCRELGIRFTANKGYPSSSILYWLGKRLERMITWEEKEVFILHLGDHDPSGIDMTRDLVDRLEMFSGNSIEIRRLALNMDQVEQYDPPENPAKVTDSRYQAYVVEYGRSSWELDALEPRVLAGLVRTTVQELRDDDLWDDAVQRENEMRAELDEFVSQYRNGKDD